MRIDAKAIIYEGEVNIQQKIKVGKAFKAVEIAVAQIARRCAEHHVRPDGGDEWVCVKQHKASAQFACARSGGAVHGVLRLRDVDQFLSANVSAMRLTICTAIFGYDFASEFRREPSAQRRFAGTFGAVKADTLHFCSALRHAINPATARTRNSP